MATAALIVSNDAHTCSFSVALPDTSPSAGIGPAEGQCSGVKDDAPERQAASCENTY